ncbi:MAG: hypothetical protein IPH31_03525 [Lewinellaceae bacterium]|nr:hypothetical protein [Lewinellaceae bacterium]
MDKTNVSRGCTPIRRVKKPESKSYLGDQDHLQREAKFMIYQQVILITNNQVGFIPFPTSVHIANQVIKRVHRGHIIVLNFGIGQLIAKDDVVFVMPGGKPQPL